MAGLVAGLPGLFVVPVVSESYVDSAKGRMKKPNFLSIQRLGDKIAMRPRVMVDC